jgi:hypothetical protein
LQSDEFVMMLRNKLLIVGAGPVGLAMAKALKDRGIAYEHVDAGPGVGGNWAHGLYSNVHIVSSKGSTAYADFPMPADYPHFPSAAQMLRYLQNYARTFGLEACVETGRSVTALKPLPDDRWLVVLDGGERRVYKGVVVCNGHHRDPRMPDYPGTFTGEMIHANTYREPEQLRGKRVLVIGGGNSACDIASEAARVGQSSDMSLRSGYWFLPKTAFGRPLTDLPIWNLPVFLQRLILRGIIAMQIGDYRSYGLERPMHKMFERHPTFGTEILGYMAQGRIKPRADIERFEGSTVHFRDGTSGDYDLVVAATGYANNFPFLPAGMIEVNNDAAQIYGSAFPASAKNLYIIGSNQPRNGFGNLITPAAALYARLIEMQDEIVQPIGAVLKWSGELPPANNYVDPGAAKREIWASHYFLWYLRWQGRRLEQREPWKGPARQFMADPAEGGDGLPINDPSAVAAGDVTRAA